MTQKKGSPSRRQWRHGRSRALADVLRGIAAINDIRIPMSNDVGMVRRELWRAMGYKKSDMLMIGAALTSAAQAYDNEHPKPPN